MSQTLETALATLQPTIDPLLLVADEIAITRAHAYHDPSNAPLRAELHDGETKGCAFVMTALRFLVTTLRDESLLLGAVPPVVTDAAAALHVAPDGDAEALTRVLHILSDRGDTLLQRFADTPRPAAQVEWFCNALVMVAAAVLPRDTRRPSPWLTTPRARVAARAEASRRRR